MATGGIHQVIKGGPQGCLLLHGFSGSPLEMTPLAEALAREGWTVAVARLAGHGTSPADLAATRWRDWTRSTAVAFRYVRRLAPRVAVVGLSMGGALALHLAASQRPAAVVAISTPIRIRTAIAAASRAASRILPYAPVVMPLGPRERAMRAYRSPYRAIPLRAMPQLELLLAAMRAEVPKIRAPLLVVQGRRDWVIPKESGRELLGLAARTEARLLWLPRSGHVATLDRDRAMLFREVAGFLRGHLGGRGEGGGRGAAD